MTEVARLYETHAALTNAVRQSMASLKTAMKAGDRGEAEVWRDVFEKNTFALHTLDEIIYGKPRNLTDVLEPEAKSA